jgi:hypothetical protein
LAMVTREPIVCECGHKGSVRCKENDQPYSDSWEIYTLEGFDGGQANFAPYCKDMVGLLMTLTPRCPHCGQIGRVSYA